ncbi:membrane fusion protein Use1-domain-containing protein [Hypoxylon sp. FL1857]|nr:membrane fusion protein Use1-domain-containing protein [Hypoxylon sp. FL1857]
MARLAQAPMTPRRTISNPDSLPDLNRLLARLQENILHADAERERRLRTSEYERSKARVNIDYARSLLTKLEQDALAVKVHSRRQELQADLNQKREVLEQVTERFQELDEVGVDSDEDSSEGEDLLGDIIETPSESVESGSAADRQGGNDDGGDAGEQEQEEADESTVLPEPRIPDKLRRTESATSPRTATTTTEAAPQPTATGTSTSQTLRPRAGASQPTPQTDKAETTALRTELFGNRTDTTNTASSPSTTATATATAEAIMDHHRAEQDKLTESMVAMARALKESSHRFASSLQEDQEVLGAATTNLERNERGLGAVAGRMGLLRRATEGKGWWGRILLYVWIAGLAVFAVLLVFVFPKLRF